MTNLINQDSAGNTFYNYITPIVKGVGGTDYNANALSFLQTAFGVTGVNITFPFAHIRFPAPGIETKTNTVTANAITWRVKFYAEASSSLNGFPTLATGNSSANSQITAQLSAGAGTPSISSDFSFKVANDYSLCGALFSSTMVFKAFYYYGWLREPSYTGGITYPRGLVALSNFSSVYVRVGVENNTAVTSLSTAADSITTPPLNCSVITPGADATDITIRDAASPHNPVGKLWNCIQLPASCNVGEVWRNVGVDADSTGSEQDVYLCIMPWGTAKLGMRVWTENVN